MVSINNLEKEIPLLMKAPDEYTIGKINCDTICLKSQFLINGILKSTVVMTKNYLALCQKGVFLYNVYLFYTKLSFDLKFQIIYERSQSLSNGTQRKKKKGFRILKENLIPVAFEIDCQEEVQIWVQYLTKSINQYVQNFKQIYKKIRILGEGAFANVLEISRQTDQKHFAVKSFSKIETVNSPKRERRLGLINEIQLMRALQNPFIIKLKGVYESKNSLYLVLEYLTGKSLRHRIDSRLGKFFKNQIRQLMIGISKALIFMHQNRIMHRDIKPDNIMMRSEESMSPVIIDFGLSINVSSDDYINYKCGTPGFIAPEIFALEKGKKIEPVCDIFSLGAIFHELLVKKPLFNGKSPYQLLEHNRECIFNWDIKLYKNVDPLAMDLLQKMLKKEPQDRITAAQILHHPYLEN